MLLGSASIKSNIVFSLKATSFRYDKTTYGGASLISSFNVTPSKIGDFKTPSFSIATLFHYSETSTNIF